MQVSSNLVFVEVRLFLSLLLVFSLQFASQILIFELGPFLFMACVPYLLEHFPCFFIYGIHVKSIFRYIFNIGSLFVRHYTFQHPQHIVRNVIFL